jgi:hypothetical protein
LPSSKVDFFINSWGKSRLFDLLMVQDEEVSNFFFPVGSNAAFSNAKIDFFHISTYWMFEIKV